MFLSYVGQNNNKDNKNKQNRLNLAGMFVIVASDSWQVSFSSVFQLPPQFITLRTHWKGVICLYSFQFVETSFSNPMFT